MGTYIKATLAKDLIMRRSSAAIIGKPRDRQSDSYIPEKITFTKEMARSKRFVPGVGSYKPNYEF